MASSPAWGWDWNADNTFGLVELSDHSMFLRAAGPARQPGSPAVLIEAGLGQSSTHWMAVMRLISPTTRVYAYDRSGQGGSEASLLPRTAEHMANELILLLEKAGINGPYILVAHSYGGIIAREFLEREKGNEVIGLVLVDARTEFSDARRPEGLEDCLHAVFEGLDFQQVLKFENRNKLNDQELACLASLGTEEEMKRRQEATGGEYANYQKSCKRLEEKRQFERRVMGDLPVSVVKGNSLGDMQLLLDAAVAKGQGSVEQRAMIEQWLAKPEVEVELQAAQLQLSSRGRLIHASLSGHDVHLTQPDVISEEVRWIVGVLEEGLAGIN
jgi:pimeloyl-ACP methyl ester carboxylesterase